jgi:hypothetical protein
MTELPLYLCHKRVRAAKITGIEPRDDGADHVLLLGDFGPRTYSPSAMEDKPKPEVGWYLVEYDGGRYFSFSPADAFEDGYTLAPAL